MRGWPYYNAARLCRRRSSIGCAPKIRFAGASPVEGSGFELSVPESWTLSNPVVGTARVGFRGPAEVTENLGSLGGENQQHRFMAEIDVTRSLVTSRLTLPANAGLLRLPPPKTPVRETRRWREMDSNHWSPGHL